MSTSALTGVVVTTASSVVEHESRGEASALMMSMFASENSSIDSSAKYEMLQLLAGSSDSVLKSLWLLAVAYWTSRNCRSAAPSTGDTFMTATWAVKTGFNAPRVWRWLRWWKS